jgi:hypothetical protein
MRFSLSKVVEIFCARVGNGTGKQVAMLAGADPGRFASVRVIGAAARLQCREFGAVVDVPIPKAAP